MPIFIDEVIVETHSTQAPAADAQTVEQQTPMAVDEFELARTLTLMHERQARLAVD